MLGDALYSSRKICAPTESYGITTYFLPSANATFREKAVESWKVILDKIVENSQAWLEEYHMRSISKSVDLILKRKMPMNDPVFVFHCEFTVHLNIPTACTICFRMPFLYLFYNSILKCSPSMLVRVTMYNVTNVFHDFG